MTLPAPTLVAPRRVVPGLEGDVGGKLDVGVYPGRARIDDGDARAHVLLEQALSRLLGDACELNAVVDAHGHGGIRGEEARDGASIFPHQRQDVAEVVLALGVVVAEALQRVGERPRLEGIAARVHLPDRELLGRGVSGLLGLDDSLHPAVAVADDPPVAAGIVHLDRHHRRPGAGLAVLADQPGDRLRGDQWVVAGEDEHGLAAPDHLQRGAQRATGAVSLGLDDGLGPVRKRRREVAVRRDDHRHPLRAGPLCGKDGPGDHRSPTDGVKDLGERGPHPRPLPRSHHECGWGRRAHPQSLGARTR